jgi:hypothetical protein
MRTIFLSALVLILSPLAAAAEDRPLDLRQLLEQMSGGGKRKFLWEEGVAARWLERKVSLTPEAAEGDASFAVGLSLLRTAGLAAVAIDDAGPATWRIVTEAEARKHVGKARTSVDDLPPSDEYAALQVTLKNARVRNVFPLVQGLVTDPRNVLAEEEGNTIWIADYSQSLRRAGDLLRRIDADPAAGVTWRLSVAAVEADADGDGNVPEAFSKAGLPEATGRRSFRLVADGSVGVSLGGDFRSGSGSNALRMKLGGGLSADVRMAVQRDSDASPVLESFEVSIPDKGEQPFAGSLGTRVATKPGAWTIAGTIPSKDSSRILVLLVRADPGQ